MQAHRKGLPGSAGASAPPQPSLGNPWALCLLTPVLDERVTGLLLIVQAVAIVVMALALRRRSLGLTSADDRLRFERLMGELSSELTTVSTDRVDEALGRWVARLGSHFEADRVALVQFSDHSTRLHPTHTSDAVPWPPLPDAYEAGELPSLVGEIRQGRVVRLSRLADVPGPAGPDQVTLRAAGVQALVAAPLAPGGRWPDPLRPHQRPGEDLPATVRK